MTLASSAHKINITRYPMTGSTYATTPVTLTRYYQRRTSIDSNDSDSTSKVCKKLADDAHAYRLLFNNHLISTTL